MRKLIVYPNCSKGGVATVIRGRARQEPKVQFDVVHFADRGGREAFADLPNVNVRIVREDRSASYFEYLISEFKYDAISVLSHPKTANLLSQDPGVVLTYEFHSSAMDVIQKEISQLALDRIATIMAPSRVMAGKISQLLPVRMRLRVGVEPNLVDSKSFHEGELGDFFADSQFGIDVQGIPLVWVGRFDRGKGYQYFLRLLAQLPECFVGHVVVSLEDDPKRASAFLSECDSLGINDRIRLYLNLTQEQLGNLYRTARFRGGWHVSTSLMESFGYSVAESVACGLRVAAFDLPVWGLHSESGLVKTVPPGDVFGMRDLILD